MPNSVSNSGRAVDVKLPAQFMCDIVVEATRHLPAKPETFPALSFRFAESVSSFIHGETPPLHIAPHGAGATIAFFSMMGVNSLQSVISYGQMLVATITVAFIPEAIDR